MARTFTVEYVELIHDELLALFWPGVEPVSARDYRNTALIDSALTAPFQRFDGRLLVRGVERRAARIFHGLIANHPFANGNKRTAVLVLDHFCLLNSRYLALSADDMHDLAVDTASYRERGTTHQQMVEKIEAVLRRAVVTDSEASFRGYFRLRERLLLPPYSRDL